MIFKNIFFEKKFSLTLFCFLIILYMPFILYGDFVRDDWFLRDLNTKTSADAYYSLWGAFSNRPFAVIFFFITSRISDEFVFYALLNLIILFISIIIIFRSFEEFFEDSFIKITFLISMMIPIYSMTNLFSPAMQILGNVSLFIWSLSLLSQKIFFETQNKKYLFLSFIFITFMLLTYESAFPLLSLSVFFPIFKKETKYFLVIFLITFLSVIVGFLIQKFFLPIFSDDISRFRIDDENIIFVIRLFLINIALQINIFFLYFSNIHLALSDVFSNYLLTIYSISIIIIFFSFLKVFQKQKLNFFIKNNYVYNINFFSISLSIIFCIFLISVMHTVAKSGVSFWGYNNRALLSLSVISCLLISLLYGKTKYKKILKFFIFSFLIIKFLYLFAFQLNHVSYSHKISNKVVEISKLFRDKYEGQVTAAPIYFASNATNNKKTLIIFYSRKNFVDLKLFKKASYINDSFDFRYLMEDISDTFFVSDYQIKNNVNFFKKNILDHPKERNGANSGFYYIKGYHLNNFKYCNKNMWDNYYRDYIMRDFDRDVYLIYDYDNKISKKNLIKIEKFEEFIDTINSTAKCSEWSRADKNDVDQYSNLASELSGKTNQRKLFYYDSIFLRFLIKIYNSFFRNII